MRAKVGAMSFDRGDIRRTMDVYTLDNAYLGTVLKIVPGRAALHEESVEASARQTSRVNGELLGPMPTQPIGNQSPIRQGAQAQYDTATDAEQLGDGALIVGRWWGLRGRRTIPLADVQTVSLERVVLKQRRATLE